MIRALLLLACIACTVVIPRLVAATNTPQLVVYYGQNKASNFYTGSVGQEQDLATICRTSQYTTIHLAFLRDFSSLDGLPGIDYSNHCTFPTDASLSYYRSMNPTSGFALLSCPDIGYGIATCQSFGKKVLLSVSPLTTLAGLDVNQVADNLWNLFFSGSHPQRPFGNAVLDGIDLAIRNNDYTGYPALINRLKYQQQQQQQQAPFTVTVSPRCDFPDAILGPVYSGRVLSSPTTLAQVDTINVFFTSSSTCSLGKNPAGFKSTLQQWATFATTNGKALTITVPGLGYGYEPYMESMAGDFWTPTQLLNRTFWSSVFPTPVSAYLKGVGMFDGSADPWHTPCAEISTTTTGSGLSSTSKYSDILWWALQQVLNDASPEGTVSMRSSVGPSGGGMLSIGSGVSPGDTVSTPSSTSTGGGNPFDYHPPTSTAGASTSPPPIGAIVGGSVGGVIGIGAIAGGLWVWKRRRVAGRSGIEGQSSTDHLQRDE